MSAVAFVLAAAVGAPARVLLDGWVQDRTTGDLPWGTLVVNLVGCLALGLLVGVDVERGLPEGVGTVVGTGALGAFTTFSTFSVEAARLVEEGDAGAAVRYVVASVLLGLLAAALGLAAAGTLI